MKTKLVNGVEYILYSGRWHKRMSPAQRMDDHRLGCRCGSEYQPCAAFTLTTTREGRMDCKHPSLQVNEQGICCDCGECVNCGVLLAAARLAEPYCPVSVQDAIRAAIAKATDRRARPCASCGTSLTTCLGWTR